MNRSYFSISLIILSFLSFAAGAQRTRLIVRADDMGITHSTNLACENVYMNGIARSVEIIAPSPWFLEAVNMLQRHPECDAGIHLVITSEWSNLKWRPITGASTLTDSNGYFYPTIWQGTKDFPSLKDNHPNFDEVEKELRAQIETAKKHLPGITHLSTHMGFDESDPELKRIVQKLSREYRLPIAAKPVINDFPDSVAMHSNRKGDREAAFIVQLAKLEKGKTYMLVTHPCYDTQEMETVFTASYSHVGKDRQADFDMLTSKKVLAALKKYGISLITIKEALTQ